MTLIGVRFTRGRRKFIKYPAVIDEFVRTHTREIGPEFVKEFDDIVDNWTNKPVFTTQMNIDPDGFRLYLGVAGSDKSVSIWWWNVQGTSPHPIVARNAKTLVFEWGGYGSYQPKTGPGGSFFGGSGTVVGGAIVRPLAVMHPGTDPRNWPAVVREKKKGFYSSSIENAWKRATRRMAA